VAPPGPACRSAAPGGRRQKQSPDPDHSRQESDLADSILDSNSLAAAQYVHSGTAEESVFAIGPGHHTIVRAGAINHYDHHISHLVTEQHRVGPVTVVVVTPNLNLTDSRTTARAAWTFTVAW
jgi:hypothetical protein